MSNEDQDKIFRFEYRKGGRKLIERTAPEEHRATEDFGQKWKELTGPAPLLFQPSSLQDARDNLKDASIKSTDENLASFFWHVGRALKFTKKKKLYLSPNWELEPATEINGIYILTAPTVTVKVEKVTSDDYRKFAAAMIETRAYSSPYKAYINEIRKRGKETFRDCGNGFSLVYRDIVGDKTIQVLSSLDWFLLQHEDKNIIKYRFGTLTTHLDGMAAFRDFSYMFGLFPSQKGRPVMWMTSDRVSESFSKIWDIGSEVGKDGSVFPYMKSLGLIYRSDLSATEHKELHNYIHFIGALLGKRRSHKSTFLEDYDTQDVSTAAMCVMANMSTSSGPIFKNASEAATPFMDLLRGVSTAERDRPEDDPNKWIDFFNTPEGYDYVMSHLSNSVSKWKDEWEGSIGQFLHDQYGKWRPDTDR